MIKKIPYTEYIIVCDECNTETLGSYDASEEIAEAKRDGWSFTPRCFNQDVALCPKCRKQKEGNA